MRTFLLFSLFAYILFQAEVCKWYRVRIERLEKIEHLHAPDFKIFSNYNL